jgi:beta-lactamase class D
VSLYRDSFLGKRVLSHDGWIREGGIRISFKKTMSAHHPQPNNCSWLLNKPSKYRGTSIDLPSDQRLPHPAQPLQESERNLFVGRGCGDRSADPATKSEERRSFFMTSTVLNIIEPQGNSRCESGRLSMGCISRKAPSRLPHYIAILFVACAFFGVSARGQCEDTDLGKLFTDRMVDGTILISSLDGSQTYVHNERRANTRFVPASTFKILNTLIALDEGAIADDKVTIEWDGKDKGVKAWNRDQTLETAFKSSCIWFYQELARRVGTKSYEGHLEKAAYGNARPGPELRTFWLKGDLKISATEQVEFLKKIYRREPPYRPSSYEILQRIMTVEQEPTYTLWGKTGWDQKIGWFVGYVEAKDKVWFFATNIDITSPEQARYRQEIVVEALRLKGILQATVTGSRSSCL